MDMDDALRLFLSNIDLEDGIFIKTVYVLKCVKK